MKKEKKVFYSVEVSNGVKIKKTRKGCCQSVRLENGRHCFSTLGILSMNGKSSRKIFLGGIFIPHLFRDAFFSKMRKAFLSLKGAGFILLTILFIGFVVPIFPCSHIPTFPCSNVPMFQCSNEVLAWTPPASPPPGGNVAAPLNTGDDAQGKTGSLGIGTATPSATLDVGGVFKVTSSGVVTGAQGDISMWENDEGYLSTDGIINGLIHSSATGTSYITGGLVGIGTTSPGALLDLSYGATLYSAIRTGSSLLIHSPSTTVMEGRMGIIDGDGFGIQSTRSSDSAGRNLLLNPYGGDVGINTISPGYKLDVYTPTGNDSFIQVRKEDNTQKTGVVFSTTIPVWQNYVDLGGDDSLVWQDTTAKRMTLTQDGYLGIGSGYTSPNGLLDVNNKLIVTDEQITMNVPLNLATAGDISIASDLQFTNPTASYIKSYAPMYIEAGDPSQNVDLTLRASNSGVVVVDDELRVTSNSYLTTVTMSGNIDVQNYDVTNVDKLTVNTIDPIHEIDGDDYATYVSFYAGGQKMETSGIITLKSVFHGGRISKENQEIFSYVIDFDKLEKGSDLWLFWKTIHQDMDSLVVLLSPSFEGKVWYEKVNDSKLIIFAKSSGEVSYSLTAPRYDYEKWPNLISLK